MNYIIFCSRDKVYSASEGLNLVKETAKAKFDESIDAAINLGIDAEKSDQAVRGALVLPNGIGKTTRVAVFAQGDAADAAKKAGNPATLTEKPKTHSLSGFIFGGPLVPNFELFCRLLD